MTPSSFKNTSIRLRMLMSAGVISVLTAVVAIFGYRGIAAVDHAMGKVSVNAQAIRNHVEGDMMHDGMRGDVMAAMYDAANGAANRKGIEGDVVDHADWFRRVLGENEKLPLSGQTKEAIAAARPALDAYIQSAQDIVKLAYVDLPKAKTQIAAFETAFSDLETRMEALSSVIEKENEETAEAAKPIARNSELMLVLVTLISAIVGSLLMLRLSSGITKAITQVSNSLESIGTQVVAELARSMEALAQGDLTVRVRSRAQRVSYDRSDEIGVLVGTVNELSLNINHSMDALNQAQSDLTSIVEGLATEAAKLNETGEALNQSATSNSRAAEELSQSTEETVSSGQAASEAVESLSRSVTSVMSDLTTQGDVVLDASATLTQTTAALEEVVQSAKGMSSAAQEGRSTLKETTEAIARVDSQAQIASTKIKVLDETGRKIGDIVSTISEIAEQTNLLALNAAIEAARAGENGRGFAVVADEVRKLAEESQLATQQIESLIMGVVSAVGESVDAITKTNAEIRKGSEMIQATDQSFDAIMSVIQGVTSQIAEVHRENDKMLRVMEHAVDIAKASKSNSDDLASQELRSRAEMVQQSMEMILHAAQQNTQLAQHVQHSTEDVEVAAERLREVSRSLVLLANGFTIESSSNSVRMAA